MAKRIRAAIRVSGIAFLLALISMACAPTYTWVSRPESQTAEHPAFSAVFEPIKQGDAYYSAFRLMVVNKTGKDLAVDWNRSRYFWDGKYNGGFAFKGISPEAVREETLPADIIPPGGDLMKIIAPVRLIAFAPMRGTGVGIAEEGIRAGKIPEGENGILLVLRRGEEEFKVLITVRIEAVSQQ